MNTKSDAETAWSTIIKPHAGLFNIRFSEIWKYRDLLKVFVKRDLFSQYKQTILGPIWFVAQPVITTLVFVFIFGNIAQLPTAGIPRILFYLSGLVIWNYFADCVQKTSLTFVANVSVMSKVYFPRLILPFSNVLASLAKFGLQFAILLFFMGYYFYRGQSFLPGIQILIIPVLLLNVALLGLGIGIIIASLTVKYRDLQYLIGFALQIVMYLSPVVYPLSSVSGKYKFVLMLNPMSSMIEAFRVATLGVGSLALYPVCISMCISCVVFISGLILFNKVEKTFIDTI